MDSNILKKIFTFCVVVPIAREWFYEILRSSPSVYNRDQFEFVLLKRRIKNKRLPYESINIFNIVESVIKGVGPRTWNVLASVLPKDKLPVQVKYIPSYYEVPTLSALEYARLPLLNSLMVIHKTVDAVCTGNRGVKIISTAMLYPHEVITNIIHRMDIYGLDVAAVRFMLICFQAASYNNKEIIQMLNEVSVCIDINSPRGFWDIVIYSFIPAYSTAALKSDFVKYSHNNTFVYRYASYIFAKDVIPHIESTRTTVLFTSDFIETVLNTLLMHVTPESGAADMVIMEYLILNNRNTHLVSYIELTQFYDSELLEKLHSKYPDYINKLAEDNPHLCALQNYREKSSVDAKRRKLE